MREEWRDVAGYAGVYQVSSEGRVKSLARVNAQGRAQPERILKQTPLGGRYLRVSLVSGGAQKVGKVHQLVCTAFHGARPSGMVARHLDGDNRNNRAVNLAWGTPGENQRDRRAHGTAPVGEQNGRVVLTDAQVVEVRSRALAGEPLERVGRAFGISGTHVRRLRDGVQRLSLPAA